MGLEVSYEPRTIFNERIKKNHDTILHLDDFLIYSQGNEETFSQLTSENIAEAEALVLTTEGMSRLNSHVFEKIPDYIKILSNRFEFIYINNPPNILLKSLEILENIEYKEPFHYRNIGENQIKNLAESFDDEIIGQKIAKRSILRSLVKMQWRKKTKKPLVLMFYGKPGIGKTETAKFLAKKLYGGIFVREQMSMASNENSMGYYKSTKHTEASFSKALMNRTSNLILLDEFALAHPLIQTAFFQLFDEGIYTDSNYTVDMRNSIIICTSNLLSVEEMHQQMDGALLSRFDAFIPFKPFTSAEKELIIKKILEDLKKEVSKKYLKNIDWIEVEKELITKVSTFTNMRNIKNYVEDYLSEQVLQSILNL